MPLLVRSISLGLFHVMCKNIYQNPKGYEDVVLSLCCIDKTMNGWNLERVASICRERCYSLKVPPIHGLVNAAKTEDDVLVSFWILVNILAHHMEKTKGNGPDEQWHEGILLQLVSEDGYIALALGTHRHPLLGISDGDVEARSGSANTHRCNTQPSR
jgi:hypothetical protein